MCKSKSEGGHRCASHSPANRRAGRAAIRIFGRNSRANRRAVAALPEKYAYGTIAERIQIAETTTDLAVFRAQVNDQSEAVRNAGYDPDVDDQPRNSMYTFHQVREPLDEEDIPTRNDTGIPRKDPELYGGFNCVALWQLRDRGWTDAQIDHILGDPDAETTLWGIERAQQAEAQDAQLRKRLERVAAKNGTVYEPIKDKPDRSVEDQERFHVDVRGNNMTARDKRAADAKEKARLDAQIPRKTPWTTPYGESVTDRTLKGRGWTESSIERLLGEEDFPDEGDVHYSVRYREWAGERVQQAEDQDKKLRKHIAAVEKKRGWANETVQDEIEFDYAEQKRYTKIDDAYNDAHGFPRRPRGTVWVD